MQEKNINYWNERLHNLWTTPEEKKNKERNLTPENLAKIMSLKNIGQNKRCFIIGGSPSVKQLDLTNLDNEIVFTVNRGYLLADFGLSHSDYHIIQDKLLAKDEGLFDELQTDFIKKLILYAGISYPNVTDKVVFYDFIQMVNYTNNHFESDLSQKLIDGFTVIFTALQICAWMNFKKIYILGVDLDYKNTSGYAYKASENELQRQVKSDINSGRMLASIEIAVKELKKIGIDVYNASPVGKLDCMPRVNFEDLF